MTKNDSRLCCSTLAASEMTYYVSSGTSNATYSAPDSLSAVATPGGGLEAKPPHYVT